MSSRIYSENEVQKLIKRAAELDAEFTVADSDGSENGLTIDEVKHIVQEAGLKPQLIEQAAFEMEANSSDFENKVRVNSDEIASEEIWLDRHPDGETMEELVTELNHLYGSTGELNWHDDQSVTHKGKAKVKRTTNKTEWIFKTADGMYITRVLMRNQRGRFRIQANKHKLFQDLNWNGAGSLLVVVIVAFFLGGICGIGSLKFIGTFWPGLMTGIALSFFSVPVTRYCAKRAISKHKNEIAHTVRKLSNLVLQSSNDEKNKPKSQKTITSASEVDIPNKSESSESQSGRFSNKRRE